MPRLSSTPQRKDEVYARAEPPKNRGFDDDGLPQTSSDPFSDYPRFQRSHNSVSCRSKPSMKSSDLTKHTTLSSRSSGYVRTVGPRPNRTIIDNPELNAAIVRASRPRMARRGNRQSDGGSNEASVPPA